MIEVEGLTRSYGNFRAVDDVSFRIERGQVVGLLGHNGAGKTTIMKMLTGYLEPSSGRIVVDELDIDEQRRAVQQRIGYLPENCPVYPEMTVIDYLEYQATLRGVPEGARVAALQEAIRRTELEAKADQPIATLSRGYRQRVGVAQAILHRPEILILDEPTNGLDPSQIQHMRALIRELSQHSTIILSTHILQEVQAVCDRVLIIRQGRLALDARLAELAASQRLLLTLDQTPDATRKLLKPLPAITSVEHQGTTDGQYRYALAIDGDAAQVAPQVARAVLEAGSALFALHPEARDLDTVFGEINRAPAKEVSHA